MAAPVLIDTDPGIDDALALLMGWSSPEISVEAVTTVAGNVPVEQGTVNVFRLLGLRKPTPRPVIAVGAAEPLARPLLTAQRYHGEDGLGDLPDWPETEKPPLEPDAVSVIVEHARRLQRLLTLVALGPLTNLALTLKSDADAVSLIGRIVAMGGAVDVPGNITPTAEFNMYVDPEAAHRVFAAHLPLDLVPLDATRQAVLPRAGLKSALRRESGPLVDRIVAFSERGFRLDHSTGARGLALHHPLAPELAIDPTLGEGRRRGRVTLLNPAPMRDEARDLVALADYLTPNETETERLSGVVVRGAESAAAAARALRSRGRGRRVQRRPRGGARRGARAPGRAALRQRDRGARVHAPRHPAVAAPAGPGRNAARRGRRRRGAAPPPPSRAFSARTRASAASTGSGSSRPPTRRC